VDELAKGLDGLWVNAIIDERGQQFLEEVDAWLGQHRIDANDSSTTPVRLGMGVFAIAGPLPKGTQS
ncbi:MAG: hypothetical protein AAGJ36_02175, partial [Pseudomonadota bacterium]